MRKRIKTKSTFCCLDILGLSENPMMVPKSTIHKQKREFFCSCFYIIMSSLAHSNLSQNDAEILEK